MAENGRKSTEIYRLPPVVRVFTQPGSRVALRTGYQASDFHHYVLHRPEHHRALRGTPSPRSFTTRQPGFSQALAAHQRDDLRGKPLQALDALRDRPPAKIEDQLVHADRREGLNVGSDLFRPAREGPVRSVRRWNAGVV